jgi:hypothetical protein
VTSQVSPWRVLAGLAISGFLLALPGGLLPLWGYHIDSNFGRAADYFAIIGAGMGLVWAFAPKIRSRWAAEKTLAGGCFAAALSLLTLAVAAPPAPFWLQAAGLALAGAAAGAIHMAIFECLAGFWERSPADIALTGGIFFGMGSALAAWLMAQAMDSESGPRVLAVAALFPGATGVWFGRMSLGLTTPAGPAEPPIRDLRTILAALFGLLLFVQFANEWAMAGWLPVFLIDRLGISPGAAVTMLAIYWLALTAGRVVVSRLLSVVRHGRILAFSAFFSLFGCFTLLASGTRAGMVVGILLTGAGFAAILPLAAERIATRFASYHAGYFNNLFTFAVLGGSLSPFMLGRMIDLTSLRAVPVSLMVGSIAVIALLLLIRLGRKVSGT